MNKQSDTLQVVLARNIKAVVFDGDGVIFTSQVFFDAAGEALKERSFIDGQGISLLRSAGVQVALITAEKSAFAEIFVAKMNSLPSVKSGMWQPMELVTDVIGQGKVDAVEKWIKSRNLSWDECAYMGDDIGDYKVMEKVAFRACPIGAEEAIKSFSHFVSTRAGGQGAVRDLCNFILKAKGIDQLSLDLR